MIKLFALDVDGTLTDGGVYMDGNGGEFKRFDIQDGYGLVQLMAEGVKVVFISGRYSAATRQRADNLKITRCLNGTKDKLSDLKELCAEWGILPEEVAFAGDDLPDAECVEWAGLGIAVANARPELKAAADRQTACSGGHGAIRECADLILNINGVKQCR